MFKEYVIIRSISKKINALFITYNMHRWDSIPGTDHIANPFSLNLRVSTTKIENLRLQFGGDIILVTFGNFVTLLVWKNVNKLICIQYFVSQFL